MLTRFIAIIIIIIMFTINILLLSISNLQRVMMLAQFVVLLLQIGAHGCGICLICLVIIVTSLVTLGIAIVIGDVVMPKLKIFQFLESQHEFLTRFR